MIKEEIEQRMIADAKAAEGKADDGDDDGP